MAPLQVVGPDNPVILGAVRQPGLQLLEPAQLVQQRVPRNQDQHSH